MGMFLPPYDIHKRLNSTCLQVRRAVEEQILQVPCKEGFLRRQLSPFVPLHPHGMEFAERNQNLRPRPHYLESEVLIDLESLKLRVTHCFLISHRDGHNLCHDRTPTQKLSGARTSEP